jgi:putative nucleotidyltransferase with HDIG domain
MTAEKPAKTLEGSGKHSPNPPEPEQSRNESHQEHFPSPNDFIGWILVLTFGLSALVVSFTAHHILWPGFKVGDRTDHDVRANKVAYVVDDKETRKAEARARHSIMPVFKEDTSQYKSFTDSIQQTLDRVHVLQKLGINPAPKEITPELHVAALTDESPTAEWRTQLKPVETAVIDLQRKLLSLTTAKGEKYSRDEIYLAVAVSPDKWDAFSQKVIRAAHKTCHVIKRFPVDDNKFWNETVLEFLPDEMPPPLRTSVATIFCNALKPNFVIDEDATRKKGDEVAATVKPNMKAIRPGEIILSKGNLVTDQNLKVLDSAAGSQQINWAVIVALFVSILAGSGLIGMFLFTFETKHFFSASSLGLMFTVCVLASSVATIIGKTWPQFVPLPMAALVLSIFFGRRTAMVVSFPLLALLALDHVIGLNDLIALIAASGAAIGMYSKHRHDLVRTGLVIGITQALGYLASLAFTAAPISVAHLGKLVGLEFLGGISSAMFAIGVLPFLENLFGMMTPFRLAEIVNADQPLLRRLEEEAPGTYQHSLAVANLAEAAAHALDVDACLVRAGALYHDIGKMCKPKYFIENQLGAKNPHDDMTPEESRDRVLGHVTDGIMLAKKYAVPKAVQDFIPMHQGTSLMAYFFHKACLRDGVENVDQRFYRYPGPKPQSKETAIVMLADVSEAVTHSMTDDPTQEEVAEAIGKVFENRWQDGQFTESGLTYDNLMKIKEAFLRVWRTIHHERLKYPATTTGRMPMPPDSISAAVRPQT